MSLRKYLTPTTAYDSKRTMPKGFEEEGGEEEEGEEKKIVKYLVPSADASPPRTKETVIVPRWGKIKTGHSIKKKQQQQQQSTRRRQPSGGGSTFFYYSSNAYSTDTADVAADSSSSSGNDISDVQGDYQF
jgi:hypothetical protein